MLLSVKELGGYSIKSTDGNAGSVEERYFDDESWEVRYIVAKAGGLIANRQVLIVPEFVDRTDRDARAVHACSTEEQVRDPPGATSDLPVADRKEFARLDGPRAYPYLRNGWKTTGAGSVHAGPYVPAQTAGGDTTNGEQGDRTLGAPKRSKVTGSRPPMPGWGTSRTSSWTKGGGRSVTSSWPRATGSLARRCWSRRAGSPR